MRGVRARQVSVTGSASGGCFACHGCAHHVRIRVRKCCMAHTAVSVSSRVLCLPCLPKIPHPRQHARQDAFDMLWVRGFTRRSTATVFDPKNTLCLGWLLHSREDPSPGGWYSQAVLARVRQHNLCALIHVLTLSSCQTCSSLILDGALPDCLVHHTCFDQPC